MHWLIQRKRRFMNWDNVSHKFIGECFCIAYCWMCFTSQMNRCMICKWFAVDHNFVSLLGPVMLISMECIHSTVLHCVIAIVPSILERSSLNIPFIYCSDRLLRRLYAFLFQTNRARPHNSIFLSLQYSRNKSLHSGYVPFNLYFVWFVLVELCQIDSVNIRWKIVKT